MWSKLDLTNGNLAFFCSHEMRRTYECHGSTTIIEDKSWPACGEL